ncbi:MAG: diphosphomevalonate decarboxylase [Lutibacter sp.]|nr:MAG: diphosphomevalonate decarboxylase [Lutibacter sp.]
MTEKDFISTNLDTSILKEGKYTWKTPSNIALVKYWGKKKNQIPENTSISFTLDACFTLTTLEFSKKQNEKGSFEIYFEGEKKDEFKPKVATFFERIKGYCPFLTEYDFVIKSRNSFPHSSGIASSASGMSALALCVMSIERLISTEMIDDYFYKKASFLARLGSGSACRSIKGSIVVWGDHKEIKDSSNLFGVEFSSEVHSNFKNFHDTILLVDEGEKQVSSTVGHQLMYNHPYAQERFKQAEENISKIKEILKSGDLKAFTNIVESEALTLHSMMMTSKPYFILMKPNTLKIINKIWEFRKETNLNLCFTLDAGANVHLLYPENEKEEVSEFVINELIQFCQNNHYICDRVGLGAKLLN